MKKSPWFKNLDCTQLEIINYKSISDETSIGMTTIKDVAFVKKAAEQINSLPSDGDEKISWKKSTKRTLLSFKCANDEWVNIEIIGNKFKTPTTGFNSEKNALEETLAQDLQLLASPQIGGRILKIKDYVVRFKDFQITFTGSEHTPQPPGGPTIGPTNNNFYRINVKDSGNTIDATIYDGQMPPGPLAFVVGKKIYYLLTYSYAKERLLPNYFVVTDKLPNRR